MIHHLAVAVRALDPPGGGAERSLSTLLRGISVQGLGFDSSAKFSPLSPSPDLISLILTDNLDIKSSARVKLVQSRT